MQCLNFAYFTAYKTGYKPSVADDLCVEIVITMGGSAKINQIIGNDIAYKFYI